MPRQTPSTHGPRTLPGSTPGGGLARQYRVQYHANDEPDWRMYASFTSRQQAEQCLNDLDGQGLRARVVEYSICPAAA